MKEERDIEMILTNLKIRPNEKAKQAAYERMMAHSKKIIAAESGKSKVRELSCDDLEGIAAAGGQSAPRPCPKCGSIYRDWDSRPCPYCGWADSASKPLDEE